MNNHSKTKETDILTVKTDQNGHVGQTNCETSPKPGSSGVLQSLQEMRTLVAVSQAAS